MQSTKRRPDCVGSIFTICTAMILSAASAVAQPLSDVPLKTVAVDQFLAGESLGGTTTGDGLTAILIDALVRDGHFVVVERTGVATVQMEQALGTTGAAAADTAVKPGQLIGASAIIRGAVIKFDPASGGAGISVGGFGLGSLLPTAGVKRQSAKLEVAIRIIDSSTGQIVASFTAAGSAGTTSTDIGVANQKTGMSVGTSAFTSTPVGQAAQDAIAKCVGKIVDAMRAVPWSSAVVDASEGRVYVAGGMDRHLRPGLVLLVVRKGKVFTDPTTGRVLDVEITNIGTIRIDEVRERMSVATLVDGAAPARGDMVVFPPPRR